MNREPRVTSAQGNEYRIKRGFVYILDDSTNKFKFVGRLGGEGPAAWIEDYENRLNGGDGLHHIIDLTGWYRP